MLCLLGVRLLPDPATATIADPMKPQGTTQQVFETGSRGSSRITIETSSDLLPGYSLLRRISVVITSTQLRRKASMQ